MPLIAAVGGLIIGGISAAKASKAAKQQNAILDKQVTQQEGLINQQKEYGQQAATYAKEFYPKADNYLSNVGDYWTKMFSGDTATVNTAMAPEVNSYLGNSRGAEKSLYNLSNRGTVGDKLIDLSFNRSADLFNMRANQRNQASTNLQNVGSIYGTMGQNALGTASGSTASASAALGSSMNLTMNRANNYSNQAQAAGMSVGQLLTTFDWSKGLKSIQSVFGGGGGGQTGAMLSNPNYFG